MLTGFHGGIDGIKGLYLLRARLSVGTPMGGQDEETRQGVMKATQYVSRRKNGTREGRCRAFRAEQIGLTREGGTGGKKEEEEENRRGAVQ